jgi:N6-adenosine-specific RNA methylase IME4
LKYGVILADPPWHYNNRKTGGERSNKTRFDGGAMKHYPLMSDFEILAMDDSVRAISDDNCALFLWATMPRLDFAIKVLKAWGFRYATNGFTWVKTTKDESRPVYGPGYYTASNAELCLLGVKGSMPPAVKMLPSIVITPRGEKHSRKPDVIQHIDRMYPDARKIELFAREIGRPGWDVWGNEVESSIDLEKVNEATS